MKLALIVLSLTGSMTLAQEQIQCSNVSCGGDSIVEQVLSLGEIFLNSDSTELSYVIERERGTMKGSSHIFLENDNGDPIDLLFEGSDILSKTGASNLSLYSNIFGDINVSSNGADGERGLDLDELCYQSIEDLTLGQSVKDYFDNSRAADATLPKDRCVQQDIDYIDGQFSCPENYQRDDSQTLSYSTIPKMRKCTGIESRSKCVQRTYDLTCTTKFTLDYNQCCDDDFPSDGRSSGSSVIFSSDTGVLSCNPSSCKQESQTQFDSGFADSVVQRYTEAELDNLGREGLCEKLVQDRGELKLKINNSYSVASSSSLESYSSMTTSYGSLSIEIEGADLSDIVGYEIKNLTPVTHQIYFQTAKGFYLNDCFMLNGSASDDGSCRRTTGPSNTFQILAVDRYGRKSNSVDVTFGTTGRRSYRASTYVNGPYFISNSGGRYSFYGQGYQSSQGGVRLGRDLTDAQLDVIWSKPFSSNVHFDTFDFEGDQCAVQSSTEFALSGNRSRTIYCLDYENKSKVYAYIYKHESIVVTSCSSGKIYQYASGHYSGLGQVRMTGCTGGYY